MQAPGRCEQAAPGWTKRLRRVGASRLLWETAPPRVSARWPEARGDEQSPQWDAGPRRVSSPPRARSMMAFLKRRTAASSSSELSGPCRTNWSRISDGTGARGASGLPFGLRRIAGAISHRPASERSDQPFALDAVVAATSRETLEFLGAAVRPGHERPVDTVAAADAESNGKL